MTAKSNPTGTEDREIVISRVFDLPTARVSKPAALGWPNKPLFQCGSLRSTTLPIFNPADRAP